MFTNMLSNFVIFNQAHPLEVSEYVNRHIGNHKLELLGQGRGQVHASRLNHRTFADLGLSSISYSVQAEVRCPELQGVYHFQVVTSGQCQWHFRDKKIHLLRGQALMVNPGEQVNLTYSADCEKVILNVPEVFVNQTCIEQSGLLPQGGVRFEHKVIDLRSSPSFLKLLDALLLEASDTELDLTYLKLPYREILIRKILQQFESNIGPGRDIQYVDRRFSTLLAYIDANIRDDISLEDLAQVGGVSVRTIYSMFANNFSITPKLFIKQSKLKSLREEFLRNKAVRNVTEVALDYGFTHLGRFSSDYFKMFGELPSETLRRRR